MEKTDQQLIADYLNGDEQALPQLIDRYLKPIYNFVYRLTGNAEDAKDITQESFVKLWKNLARYKPEESFKTWLFQIARNTAIDSMRKKKNLSFSDFETPEGENPLIESLVDPDPLPDELVARLQQKDFLERILKKLSPAHREVLILHYQHELTFNEIGKILKKPLDTVKSQHRRALIALKTLLSAPDSDHAS